MDSGSLSKVKAASSGGAMHSTGEPSLRHVARSETANASASVSGSGGESRKVRKSSSIPKKVEFLRSESEAGNSGAFAGSSLERSESEGTEGNRSWREEEDLWLREAMDMEEGEWGLDEETGEDVLMQASILALEEVIERRMRRIRKLVKLYRSQYWALVEEMRSKHRRFYLRTGRGGWREAAETDTVSAASMGFRGYGRQEPHAPDKPANATLHCAAAGPCLAKPLPLSVFCLDHILLEPRQRLYKPCAFVIRSGSGGNVHCGRPILCAVSPLLCPEHQEIAQKQATRAIRRSSTVTMPRGKSYLSKGGPKLHLIINEYVRAIQRKRQLLAVAEAAQAALVDGSPSLSGGGGGYSHLAVIAPEHTQGGKNKRKATLAENPRHQPAKQAGRTQVSGQRSGGDEGAASPAVRFEGALRSTTAQIQGRSGSRVAGQSGRGRGRAIVHSGRELPPAVISLSKDVCEEAAKEKAVKQSAILVRKIEEKGSGEEGDLEGKKELVNGGDSLIQYDCSSSLRERDGESINLSVHTPSRSDFQSSSMEGCFVVRAEGSSPLISIGGQREVEGGEKTSSLATNASREQNDSVILSSAVETFQSRGDVSSLSPSPSRTEEMKEEANVLASEAGKDASYVGPDSVSDSPIPPSEEATINIKLDGAVDEMEEAARTEVPLSAEGVPDIVESAPKAAILVDNTAKELMQPKDCKALSETQLFPETSENRSNSGNVEAAPTSPVTAIAPPLPQAAFSSQAEGLAPSNHVVAPSPSSSVPPSPHPPPPPPPLPPLPIGPRPPITASLRPPLSHSAPPSFIQQHSALQIGVGTDTRRSEMGPSAGRDEAPPGEETSRVGNLKTVKPHDTWEGGSSLPRSWQGSDSPSGFQMQINSLGGGGNRGHFGPPMPPGRPPLPPPTQIGTQQHQHVAPPQGWVCHPPTGYSHSSYANPPPPCGAPLMAAHQGGMNYGYVEPWGAMHGNAAPVCSQYSQPLQQQQVIAGINNFEPNQPMRGGYFEANQMVSGGHFEPNQAFLQGGHANQFPRGGPFEANQIVPIGHFEPNPMMQAGNFESPPQHHGGGPYGPAPWCPQPAPHIPGPMHGAPPNYGPNQYPIPRGPAQQTWRGGGAHPPYPPPMGGPVRGPMPPGQQGIQFSQPTSMQVGLTPVTNTGSFANPSGVNGVRLEPGRFPCVNGEAVAPFNSVMDPAPPGVDM